jgi:rhodanese-related sulfurtransferase
MKGLKRLAIFAMAVPALTVFSTTSAQAVDCFYESQYGILNPVCGTYKSEISPAQAFLDTVVKRWTNPELKPVLIDVRSTTEYKRGHPQNAYNVPYPFIFRHCVSGEWPDGACNGSSTGTIPQDPDVFVSYVESIVPNKDTPIYTLCRTGHRSVLAAALLADHGYTNVHNIWEGFVGLYLQAQEAVLDANGNYQYDANGNLITALANLDLNHDGQLTDEDKNGWRYHQQLPYDTRLLPQLIYQLRADLYSQD